MSKGFQNMVSETNVQSIFQWSSFLVHREFVPYQFWLLESCRNIRRSIERCLHFCNATIKKKGDVFQCDASYSCLILRYKPGPVMKTGIPCAHILTGKTCSHLDPVHIAGNLFSKQVVPCTPPVLPCPGLQCTKV